MEKEELKEEKIEEKKYEKPAKNNKAKIALRILLSMVLVIVLIIIFCMIFLSPSEKHSNNRSDSIEEDMVEKADFEEYAKSLENEVRKYFSENNKYPSFDEIVNKVPNYYNIICDVHDVNSNGSIYLAGCKAYIYEELNYSYGIKEDNPVVNEPPDNSTKTSVCGFPEERAISEYSNGVAAGKFIPVTVSNISERAHDIALGSIKSCCNLFFYNFNDADDIGIITQYDYISTLVGSSVIKKNILNQMGYDLFGTENLYDKIIEEYKNNLSEEEKANNPTFTDGDYICPFFGRGGISCQANILKSSDSKIEGNIYIFNYTYDVYYDDTLCSRQGDIELFKNDDIKPTTMHITVKYKYDETDNYLKLIYLNNDHNQ